MANKKFISQSIPELVYEVVTELWLDKDTYIIVFKENIDVDGDTYHLEVEYHKDEKKVTYTRVYDYENVEASMLVSPCFKKQIESYLLRQAGVLRDGSELITQNLSIELVLDVPNDTTIGELNEWLKALKVEPITSKDDEIKILSIENKGAKK